MIRLVTLLILLINFSPAVSLDEKIGQMLLVGYPSDDAQSKWAKRIHSHIQNGQIGGILLFAKNIASPKQLKDLTSTIHSLNNKMPLLIAVDQEGGKVQRLSSKNGFEDFPSAYSVAKKMSIVEAAKTYDTMAQLLDTYGINLNFGPTVDLNINPDSPAIGAKQRSYSAQEDIVFSYARTFVQAHQKNGVKTCLKHFPGHGSAKSDSHKEMTDVSFTWQYKELKPYYDFIRANEAESVMVGHIHVKSLDDIYPASLSKTIVSGLLRQKLGFNGVVFSDDMNMQAISKYYGFKESIIKSIAAGVDVVVFSSYFTKESNVVKVFFEAVKDALKDGLIREEQINAAYNRIKNFKSTLK